MKRTLFTILAFLILCASVFAANGDITAVRIKGVEPGNGWVAQIDITSSGGQAIGVGGTYAFGLAGNNIPSASTPVFTATSLGFDNTGTATTIARTIYATHFLRKPVFGQAYSVLTSNGTAPTNGDMVVIDTKTYTFKTTLTPTEGEVLIGSTVDASAALANLQMAIQHGGTNGTQYKCAAVHPTTYAPLATLTATTLKVYADATGTGGNSIATTTTAATLSWTSTVLGGGVAYSTTANESLAAGTLTLEIALSDYIYAKDNTGGGNSGTAVTVSIPAGLYTQGGVSTTSWSGTVTNNSTGVYQKPVANWLNTNKEIVGTSFDLRVRGGSGDVFNGLSLAAVKFTCTDAHTNTVTVTTTSPTKIQDVNWPIPVGAYVGTISTSALVQGDVLTCNFTAYPWVGDQTLYTGNAVHTQPTGLYAPLQYINDKSQTYGRAAARVNPSGVDANGVVQSLYTYNPSSPPAAFLTIAGAVNAIKTYQNTNFSRNNASGAVVYFDAGTYDFPGATAISAGSGTINSYLELTPSSGVSRAQVILGTKTAATVATYLWIDNMDITVTTSGGNVFTGMTYFKVSNCLINPANTNTFFANTIISFLGNTFNFSNTLPASTTGNYTVSPMIGNVFNLSAPLSIYPITFVGNKVIVASAHPTWTPTISFTILGMTAPIADGTVLTDNYLALGNSQVFLLGSTGDAAASGIFGALIENNVFESLQAVVTTVGMAGSTSTTDNVYNIIYRYNTALGYLTEWCYNAAYQPLRFRNFNKFQGNINSRVTTMTDLTTEGGPADPNRIGSWSATNGVGAWGNLMLLPSNTAYAPEFPGLYSAYTTNEAGAYFLLDESYLSAGKNGNGNYNLLNSSPAIHLMPSGGSAIPFDIIGHSRRNNGTGAAGPYEYRGVVGGVDSAYSIGGVVYPAKVGGI